MTCICSVINNTEFDHILNQELKLPITLADIVNNSSCISIHPENHEVITGMALNCNEVLSGLNGKIGVYHLWIEQDECTDHQKHRMLCAYVGKGQADQRIKTHLEEKWVKDEILYVSFYECSNRIAKYLEQLFLDCFLFHLNKNENTGAKYLQTLWDDDRLLNGTDIYEHAAILEKKYPDIFDP